MAAKKKTAKNKARKKAAKKSKTVEAYTHPKARRSNIPTAEMQPVVGEDVAEAVQVAIERRNRDLDPQLVWRGKDEQNAGDLVVPAPPLFIQEKVHPKALIDELRRSTDRRESALGEQTDLFGDFNGLSEDARSTEFYQHDANWTNRMILGDSLQVMASLAEREGLRGKVQCIYIDPPYGIKFNSNFQWSTTSRDVKDGKAEHISREPEQVKAFRDTWRDGIHSYLAYLRDRLLAARELLSESGSVFLQIGDENVHRARILLDEVFGAENYRATIYFVTTGGFATAGLSRMGDYVLWYAKDAAQTKYRQLFREKGGAEAEGSAYKNVELALGQRRRLTKHEAASGEVRGRVYRVSDLCGQGVASEATPFKFQGRIYEPPRSSHWKPNYPHGLQRVAKASRIYATPRRLNYVRFLDDYPVATIKDFWSDTGHSGFAYDKRYVVQTANAVVERCILMATDPGDLVLDPTCGSGTTATVAEQWGRRWITIDTSRVALALARARIMGARYPYYLLADSPDGQKKQAEIERKPPSTAPTHGSMRAGLVYERVPHITLKSIANNAEIDVIWEEFQEKLEPLRAQLNEQLGRSGERDSASGDRAAWEEWQIPREAEESWSDEAKATHAAWWERRTARQREIDASIAAKADYELLYDKPYEDKSKVRVAGPFTVESLSPHRTLTVGTDDELIDPQERLHEQNAREGSGAARHQDFASMVLDNLKTAGVQQAHKEHKIDFTSLEGWPGKYLCAQGRYLEGLDENGDGGTQRRAGIFIGPEFGTVSRQQLVRAAREAGDAGFDVVIACAFNFDAHSATLDQLGSVPVLKARMNADLHMAEDLKNTGKGNLFVIFGEPDIDIRDAEQADFERAGATPEEVERLGLGDHLVVHIQGVDVFHPQSGKVVSSGPEGIACWFVDTDYNDESFFVRQAYFLGQADPYKSLKTTLKAEIDAEAWDTLYSDVSRPFPKPSSGRIAVKVINHLGDEVMKVYEVG